VTCDIPVFKSKTFRESMERADRTAEIALNSPRLEGSKIREIKFQSVATLGRGRLSAKNRPPTPVESR
jgi:hypothetical protein